MSTVIAIVVVVCVLGMLIAYQMGYSTGRKEGFNEGHEKGRQSGESEGIKVGYDRGKHDRDVEKAKKEASESVKRKRPGCTIVLLALIPLAVAVCVVTRTLLSNLGAMLQIHNTF